MEDGESEEEDLDDPGDISELEGRIAELKWTSLVLGIREIFKEKKVPSRLTYSEVVLIPKGSGDYRGIGIVEPI